MSGPTWTGRCTGCHRDGVEVSPSRDHFERVLCERCAAKPAPPPVPRDVSREDQRDGTVLVRDEHGETRLEHPDDAAAPPAANGTAPAPPAAARRVELTPATAIRSERLHWVWTGRMPRRSLVVVAGEKGLGKSLLTNARLPALVTRGDLDGELRGEPADVVIATAEDDWASVVKPRLAAHGADLARVHRVAAHDEAGTTLLTLPDDVPRLEKEIVALRAEGHAVAMLVVDPIGAFLAQSTDTHRDASVRRALAPLAAMAERLDLVVVVVAHLTKDESGRLINRVSGAGAFVNAARSVLAMARDPGDPDGEQGTERVLLHVGSNWGSYAATLAWRVEGRTVEVDDGSTTDVGYLVDNGESTVGVDDVQRGPDDNGGDAEEAIGAALVAGPRPSREVKGEVATALGCAKKTVERAAVRMAQRGDLTIEQGGFPRTTTWALASGDTPAAPSGDTPGPPTVPTASRDVPTGISASSGDSGDTPARDVATGDDPDIARAERLAADHRDLAGQATS
ncbi:MAG: AAA family ATPase [Solirubrobacteraceae bacterium MAG38_C4-C5]|nr:AAA family ATPase [Candidatus Siliceabacter maunaloa]